MSASRTITITITEPAPLQQDIEAGVKDSDAEDDISDIDAGDPDSQIDSGEAGGEPDREPLSDDAVNPTKRGCTDVHCCLFLLICLGAHANIYWECLKSDNPYKILFPLDHAGNSCGVGKMADYPLVYYPAKKMINGGPLVEDAYYLNPKNRWSVCTSECPSEYSRKDRDRKCGEPTNATDSSEAGATCTWYSQSVASPVLGKFCVVGLNGNGFSDSAGKTCSSAADSITAVDKEARASFDDFGNMTTDDLQFLKTKVHPQHHWVVDAIFQSIQEDNLKYTAALAAVVNETKQQHLVKVCYDQVEQKESNLVAFTTNIMAARNVIAYSCLSCLFFGLCYLLLICKFVKAVVWGSLLSVILGFSFAGYYLWTGGIEVRDSGLVEDGQEEIILAVTCWILAFICLVVVLFCRRSLALAIAISEITAGFFIKNLAMMFLPFLLSVLEFFWIAYWFLGFTLICSTAKVHPADDLTQEFLRFEIDDVLIATLVCHGFMGMWMYFFFEGLGIVTTSITVTDWYFRPKEGGADGKKKSPQFAVTDSFKKALLYGSGSIALGSFLLPVALVLQGIIKLFQTLFADHNLGKKSAFFKMLGCCCGCCMGCAVSCLKFIGSDAYIMMAVLCKGFCRSAYASFSLMARNPKRFMVFKGVMWTVDVGCRFALMGATLAVAGILLNNKVAPEVRSMWSPMLVIALMSYFISGLVGSVYTTSGAALFVCFVVDEEVSAKTGRDCSLYAPSGLSGFWENEAKKDAVENYDGLKEEKEEPKDSKA